MAQPVDWSAIREWLQARVQQEQERLATAPSGRELRWAQGRLQVLLEMLKLPEAMAALESRARSARPAWEEWVKQHAERER